MAGAAIYVEVKTIEHRINNPPSMEDLYKSRGISKTDTPSGPANRVNTERISNMNPKAGTGESSGGDSKGSGDSKSDSNQSTSSGQMTTKEATEVVKKLGYDKTNETSHGQPVYKNKKRKYITPDIDGHNGGVWKGADSVKNLGSKNTCSGTYDANLNRIGD